jgi:hypothetical protein
VPAPVKSIVNELPEQIVPLVAVMLGESTTVIVLITVFELTHPFVPVPVTVYEVLTVGDTIELPPLMVYVPAPEGTIVKEVPEQILPLLTEIVGEGLMETLLTAVFEPIQPFVPVPVTLYDVLMVGDTMALPPEKV